VTIDSREEVVNYLFSRASPSQREDFERFIMTSDLIEKVILSGERYHGS